MDKNLGTLKVEAELRSLRIENPEINPQTGWMPVREAFDAIMDQIHRPGFPIYPLCNYAQLVNDILAEPLGEAFKREAQKTKEAYERALREKIIEATNNFTINDDEISRTVQYLEGRFHREWKLVVHEGDSKLQILIIELFSMRTRFDEMLAIIQATQLITLMMKK